MHKITRKPRISIILTIGKKQINIRKKIILMIKTVSKKK
jgi:hypothetical protein